MNLWMTLAFSVGFALGCILSSLRFKAKLKFYRRFIEERLSSINIPRPSAHLRGVR